MREKGLLGLTALMFAALAVLLGLGFWQLSRLQWKQGLIAQIETRTKSDPISLEVAETLASEGRDPSYFRVGVEGRFHHGREQYLYAVSDGRVGWHVITPLETANGQMVLIDRGFVPDFKRIREALGVPAEIKDSVFYEQYDTEPVINIKDPNVVEPLRARMQAALGLA